MFPNSDSGEEVDQPLAFTGTDSDDDFLFASIDSTPSTTPKGTGIIDENATKTLDMSIDSIIVDTVPVRDIPRKGYSNRYENNESQFRDESKNFSDISIEVEFSNQPSDSQKERKQVGYVDLMDKNNNSIIDESRSVQQSNLSNDGFSSVSLEKMSNEKITTNSNQVHESDGDFFENQNFMTIDDSEDSFLEKFSEDFESDEDSQREEENQEEVKHVENIERINNNDHKTQNSEFLEEVKEQQQQQQQQQQPIEEEKMGEERFKNTEEEQQQEEAMTTIKSNDDPTVEEEDSDDEEPELLSDLFPEEEEVNDDNDNDDLEKEEQQQGKDDPKEKEEKDHKIIMQHNEEEIVIKEEEEEEMEPSSNQTDDNTPSWNEVTMLRQQTENEREKLKKQNLTKEEAEAEADGSNNNNNNELEEEEEEDDEDQEIMEIERVTIDPHNISSLKTTEETIPKNKYYNVYTRNLIPQEKSINSNHKHSERIDFLLNDRNFLLNEEIESKYLNSKVFLSVILGMTIQDILNNPFQYQKSRRRKRRRKKKRKKIIRNKKRNNNNNGIIKQQQQQPSTITEPRNDVNTDTTLELRERPDPLILEAVQQQEPPKNDTKRALSPSLQKLLSPSPSSKNNEQEHEEDEDEKEDESSPLDLRFDEIGSLKETILPYLTHFLFTSETSGDVIQETERVSNLNHLKTLILLDLSRTLSKIGNQYIIIKNRNEHKNKNKKKKMMKEKKYDDENLLFLQNIVLLVLPNENKEHLVSTYITNLLQELPVTSLSGLPTSIMNKNPVVRNFRFRRRQRQKKMMKEVGDDDADVEEKTFLEKPPLIRKYKFDYWVRMRHLFELMECLSDVVFRRVLSGGDGNKNVYSGGDGLNLDVKFFSFEVIDL